MHDKTPRKSRFRGVFIDGAFVEAGVIHDQEKEARAGARRRNIAIDVAHDQSQASEKQKGRAPFKQESAFPDSRPRRDRSGLSVSQAARD
ncbi:hypothetical protein ACS0X5_08255 [Burkholderia gladioli]|uniref:hypothetical protein n=1 Tax=Burkholderia gladioli TaxID=28095 RepID=UPI0011D211BA|nr:hypothetical protein [Burkholderia gladioli]MBW5286469.1 hypothetical protein [Burkholderia gladioli]